MFPIAKRFIDNRSGNYAMMLVVLTLPVLTVAVNAVDFAIAASMRSDLQAVADSVALASVKGLEVSPATGQQAGEAVYATGLASLGVQLQSENLTLDLTTGAELKSHTEIVVEFKGLMGRNWTLAPTEVHVEADAIIAAKSIELAVATDLSPSMDAAEVKALVSSLRKLSASFFAIAKDGTDVRMAYAPFTRNVALPAYASAWISGSGTSTPGRLCVGPRSTNVDATDATPTAAIFPPFKESATYCPPEILQPLTSEQADIDALISTAEKRVGPYRGTGVYEGLAWNYRMLSPKWDKSWPVDSAPASYDKARKVALVMADGFNDASVGYTKTVADQITLDASANRKKDGIEIFIVTYKVTPDLVALYSECASSASHFIDSPDDSALETAFSAMAKKMRSAGPVLVN